MNSPIIAATVAAATDSTPADNEAATGRICVWGQDKDNNNKLYAKTGLTVITGWRIVPIRATGDSGTITATIYNGKDANAPIAMRMTINGLRTGYDFNSEVVPGGCLILRDGGYVSVENAGDSRINLFIR